MRLTRTFHPVGHGAFYTERFYEGGECVFTAVYDCGSDTLSGSSLATLIGDAQHGEPIDVLFISHFHSDHVNGFSVIQNQCKKIILPVISTEEKEMSFIHNAIVTGGIDNEANNLLKRVFSSTNNAADEQIIMVSSVERPIEYSNAEPIEIESVNTTIPAGVPLYSRKVPNWIYLPYNLHHDVNHAIKNFFIEEGILNAGGGVNTDRLSEIINGTAHDGMSLRNIRMKYNAVLRQNNPNQHSMTVYSGYKDCDVCCKCRRHYHRRYCCDYDCPFQANCLYTGDFVASESNVDNLRRFYWKYLNASATVQIPHHASANVGGYYGDDIFRYARIGIISTQFGKYSSMPSNDVVMNIMDEGVVPLFVTEHKRSKVEREYYIF